MPHSVIGYGEDALTIWALTEGLPNTLERLKESRLIDTTAVEECRVFYRPSFGRGKYGIGEFDAIIASPKTICLIECKWCSPGEEAKGVVAIPRAQCRRHRRWRAMREDWNKLKDPESDNRTVLADTEDAFAVPTHGRLIENYQYILESIGGERWRNKIVRDVCLYFVPETGNAGRLPDFTISVDGTPCDTFKGVAIPYPSIQGHEGFVRLEI